MDKRLFVKLRSAVFFKGILQRTEFRYLLTFLPVFLTLKVYDQNLNRGGPLRLKVSLSKRLAFIIAGLTTLLLISIAFARGPIRTVTGEVTKVSDGDTIHVTTPEQTKLKVRLYGIDAPETPKINHRTGQVNKPGQH